MWIETTKEDRRLTSGAAGSITRTFIAERGAGQATAEAEGFGYGTVEFVNGRLWKLNDIRARNLEGAFDEVTISWVSGLGGGGSPTASHRRRRQAGDEIWWFEAFDEQIEAGDAYDSTGSGYKEEWGFAEDELIWVGRMRLFRRTWVASLGNEDSPLPPDESAALTFASTYLSAINTTLENNKWRCATIDSDEDTENGLIQITYCYEYRPEGWSASFYQ